MREERARAGMVRGDRRLVREAHAPRLGGDRGLAAGDGRVGGEPARGRVAGPVPVDQDVIETVGEGELAGLLVDSGVAAQDPVRVGPDGAKFDVAAMTAAIPQMRDQFRAIVQWIDAQLADGRSWMCGEHVSLSTSTPT